jgi:small-conductance mechanosensitive channel
VALGDVHEEIYRRLVEASIEIPFPVRRVIQEIRDARGDGDEGDEPDKPALREG